MANRRDLTTVSPDKLGKMPGFTKVERHSALFPKQSTKPGEARTLAKRALTATAEQARPGPQPAAKPITATRVTASELAKLRAVHESSAGSAELIGQKLTPDQALGTAFAALVTLEYTKLKAERKARLAKGESSKRVDARWRQIVDEASQAFAAGGLKGLTEDDLDRFSSELTRSRANFNAVVEIANSARDVVPAPAGGARVATGNFVTIYDRFIDLNQIVIPTRQISATGRSKGSTPSTSAIRST